MDSQNKNKTFLSALKTPLFRRAALAGAAAILISAALIVPISRIGHSEDARLADEAEQQRIAEIIAPYQDTDLILPNVYVGEVSVGGMTRSEAIAAVKADAEVTQLQTIIVDLPDRQLTLTTVLPELDTDAAAAVDAAVAVGRDAANDADFCADIEAAETTDTVIPFSTANVCDRDAVEAAVQAAADSVYVAPVQTTAAVDTENHVITLRKGTDGVSLNVSGLTDAICDAMEDYDEDTTILYQYTAVPTDHVSVAGLYAQCEQEPVNASYNKETQSVDPSEVGYEPDLTVAEALEALGETASGDTLELTFHEVEPEIDTDTMKSMLFRDTLYSYGSVYASNAGRTENLRLACAAINGTVINPGEVFSFNDTVGERTAAKGYKGAIVYVDGKSETQLGGGICQVASTIYYCCLYSELEIVQREPHMFTVTYVPGGMDATVYWGSVDFQFRNNTEYPIKINACLSGGKCCIELIGTDVEQHTVKMESDYISSTCYHVYRHVYDSSGKFLRTDDIGVSRYSTHTS